jgi:putative transposase
MHAELAEEGLAIRLTQSSSVARLMRENGLKASQKRRFKRTIDSHDDHPIAPSLLDQDFACDGPDQKWGVDIRSIWTAEGRLYLAIALDLYVR